MREIKFRAKRIKNNEWVVGEPHMKCCLHHIHTGEAKTCLIDKDTLGQFTGLTDKNGKEIYEGDILMRIGHRGDKKGRKCYRKVVFYDGCFCLSVPEYGILSPLGQYIVDGKMKWEVAGNIYDNPELIKEE